MKAILLALLLVIPPALAWHDEDCVPNEGSFTAEVAGVYAWVQPVNVDHVSWGFWQESNGIAGLQRFDVVFDDTCHGAFPADTEIIAFYAV
jgi:hypothetical protein